MSKSSILLYVFLGAIAIGCKSADDGDTTPLPPKDAQAKVDQAAKGVESSQMSAEQKQAALDYLKNGAVGAGKMKDMAQSGTAGSK
jgi:hypothetical protein